jgi:cytochrome c-type biogenesis protein CcmH/NrfG
MAHEFMRQGHYDRALSIFNTLMEKRPADQELRAAMEKARRKSREKTVLAVLQGWLENIQRMRRELATGS